MNACFTSLLKSKYPAIARLNSIPEIIAKIPANTEVNAPNNDMTIINHLAQFCPFHNPLAMKKISTANKVIELPIIISLNLSPPKKDPNINIEGLHNFIQKIKNQAYFIDFFDMSNIIFFYSIITYDIYEYDKYNSGKQIKLMWDRIIKFYNNKKYIKK